MRCMFRPRNISVNVYDIKYQKPYKSQELFLLTVLAGPPEKKGQIEPVVTKKLQARCNLQQTLRDVYILNAEKIFSLTC